MKSTKKSKNMRKKRVIDSKQSMRDVYYDPTQVESFGGKSRLHDRFPRKEVDAWLPGQLAYSLHKPIRKKFPTRAYRTAGLNDTWQMDMMEMLPYARINKGYKYILVCIRLGGLSLIIFNMAAATSSPLFDLHGWALTNLLNTSMQTRIYLIRA